MTTTAGTIDMKQLSLKEIPPKVNVFCAVSQNKVYAPFFSLKETPLQDKPISKCSKTGYLLYYKQIRMTSFFNKMEQRPIGISGFELI